MQKLIAATIFAYSCQTFWKAGMKSVAGKRSDSKQQGQFFWIISWSPLLYFGITFNFKRKKKQLVLSWSHWNYMQHPDLDVPLQVRPQWLSGGVSPLWASTEKLTAAGLFSACVCVCVCLFSGVFTCEWIWVCAGNESPAGRVTTRWESTCTIYTESAASTVQDVPRGYREEAPACMKINQCTQIHEGRLCVWNLTNLHWFISLFYLNKIGRDWQKNISATTLVQLMFVEKKPLSDHCEVCGGWWWFSCCFY